MAAKKEAKEVKAVDLHAAFAELRHDLSDHTRSLALMNCQNPELLQLPAVTSRAH